MKPHTVSATVHTEYVDFVTARVLFLVKLLQFSE